MECPLPAGHDCSKEQVQHFKAVEYSPLRSVILYILRLSGNQMAYAIDRGGHNHLLRYTVEDGHLEMGMLHRSHLTQYFCPASAHQNAVLQFMLQARICPPVDNRILGRSDCFELGTS